MGLFPYADRYPVVRSFPLRGRPRNEIVAEIEAMSAEDAVALEGKISGSIYSGDEAHYAFLNEVFGHCSHANVLQRDVYPSATRFEGRDHRHDCRLDACPRGGRGDPRPAPRPPPRRTLSVSTCSAGRDQLKSAQIASVRSCAGLPRRTLSVSTC